jgi:CRISPR-associated endoribonuclease Cas6
MKLFTTEWWTTWRVTEPFGLPHHSGSLLRGILGRALRAASCVSTDVPCNGECHHTDRCAYARLFDPPLPNPLPHPLLRGATRAPQPMIPLFPPPGAARLSPGDHFWFGIRVLGGNRGDDTDRLQRAVERFGEFPLGRDGGRLALEEFTCRGPREREIEVKAAPPRKGTVTVTLETPAWLEKDGRLQTELDFPSLFTQGYRRLTMLAALYGELAPSDEEEFRQLRALAAEVRTLEKDWRAVRWERRADDSGERHPMKGLLGHAVFEGPVAAFDGVLRGVEVVHLGKGTSFGLGRIAVRSASSDRVLATVGDGGAT